MRLADLDAEGFPKFLGLINAHDHLASPLRWK